LLVDFGEGFAKIQVKSSHHRPTNTGYHFSLVRTRNNSTKSKKSKYTKEECDYFFLYDFNGNKWLIPFEVIGDKRGVSPTIKYHGYKLDI